MSFGRNQSERRLLVAMALAIALAFVFAGAFIIVSSRRDKAHRVQREHEAQLTIGRAAAEKKAALERAERDAEAARAAEAKLAHEQALRLAKQKLAAASGAPAAGNGVFLGLNEAGHGASSSPASAGQPTAAAEAKPQDKRESLRIEGRVKMADGRAAVGIQITAVYDEDSQVILHATSDANGAFQTVVPSAGGYKVSALPPADYVNPTSQSIHVREGYPSRVSFLLLKKGDTLKGLVVNEEDEPLAGATVTAMHMVPGGMYNYNYQTDAKGEFLVEGIARDRPLNLLVIELTGYQRQVRSGMTAWDGVQKFVMRRSSNLVVQAVWDADYAPIQYYAYRLLKSGFHGFEVDYRRPDVIVRNPTGTAPINDVIDGLWRVEVTVLDASGKQTMLRSAEYIDLSTPITEPKLVQVRVSGGRLLAGKVVFADGKTPANGANVRIMPPDEVGGSFERPDLNFKEMITGPDGSFAFDGMPPGQFTIVVQRDTLRPKGPIDVVISADEDPDPVTVVLQEGAVLFGRVRDSEGNGIGAELNLSTPNVYESRYDYSSYKADDNGAYRIDGLAGGVYFVSVRTNRGQTRQQQIDILTSQQKELNFDFSETVRVIGFVSTDGDIEYQGGLPRLTFYDSLGGATYAAVRDAQGRYSVTLKPGNHRATINWAGRTSRGEGTGFTVPAAVEEFQQNLEFHLTTANVLLVFENEKDFKPGPLVLAVRDRNRRFNFERYQMTAPSRRLVDFIEGEYQASYTSDDGKWQGDSGWIQLTAGKDNDIVIDVRPKEGPVRIGGWEYDELQMTLATRTYDATEYIKRHGNYDVWVQYEGGRHAAEVAAVELLADGYVVSQDRHLAWTGADRWANVYRLSTGSSAGGASYAVRVTLRSDGGTESKGGVFIAPSK